MKMKNDPPTEDGRMAKRAAAAWIENAVNNKSSADVKTQQQTAGDNKQVAYWSGD